MSAGVCTWLATLTLVKIFLLRSWFSFACQEVTFVLLPFLWVFNHVNEIEQRYLLPLDFPTEFCFSETV